VKSLKSRVPLRESSVWPGFREARPIPHRYGVCGGEALQYDDTRTRFVWADHPCAAVDAVYVGGQKSSAWTFEVAPDSTGRAVTFIVFAIAADEGKSVIARGRGKLHPVRGGVMENPADALWDVLANVGELNLPEARLAEFRAQCSDLVVGGSLEADEPLYAVARSICDSIGAVCAWDMIGFARLWPGYDGPALAEITRTDGAPQSTFVLDAICSDLTIRYAWEAGQPRGAVQYVTAVEPSYGAQAAVLDAKWISNKRVASLVCQRLLQHRARKQYDVSLVARGDIRIGQCVSIDHPLIPVTGTHMALEREHSIDAGGDRTAIVLRAPVGPVPSLRLMRNTNASEALPSVTVPINQPGNEFEVEIVDESGAPLANAQCTLDSVVTRNADSSGVVRFPSSYATPGSHTIVATVAGRPPVTLIVRVE